MSGNAHDQGWDAIVIHPDDDVAVTLHDIAARQSLRVRRSGNVETLTALAPIPLGHKVALRAISQGAVVHKYGDAIGIATSDIAAGEHVHVHNIRSQRAARA